MTLIRINPREVKKNRTSLRDLLFNLFWGEGEHISSISPYETALVQKKEGVKKARK
jgi:hypothetical protein